MTARGDSCTRSRKEQAAACGSGGTASCPQGCRLLGQQTRHDAPDPACTLPYLQLRCGVRVQRGRRAGGGQLRRRRCACLGCLGCKRRRRPACAHACVCTGASLAGHLLASAPWGVAHASPCIWCNLEAQQAVACPSRPRPLPPPPQACSSTAARGGGCVGGCQRSGRRRSWSRRPARTRAARRRRTRLRPQQMTTRIGSPTLRWDAACAPQLAASGGTRVAAGRQLYADQG